MLKLCKAHVRRNLLQSFWADRDGAVAALFGLMAIVLFLMIGGAVDFGRWLHARNTTIAAMDAAVLAAGRSLQVDGNADAAIAAAAAYYTKNTLNRLPLNSDTIEFTVSDDGMSVTAGGNAFIDTPFLGLIDINELPILDGAGADYSKAELAVGKNSGINLEISMMLDVTGSMQGDKIDDLKLAAKDLIDIVVWDDQSEYTSRVALVPFSEGIRLPASAMAAARGNPPNTYDHWYWNNGWRKRVYYRTGCMAERMGANAYTDAAPGPWSHVSTVYSRYSSANCEPNSNAVISPLSNNKADLLAAVDALTTDGGTAGQMGTAWSWYTLSPNWNSLWTSSSNHAVAYNAPNTRKIAILMTDGEYNTEYQSLSSNADRTVARESSASSATNGSSTTQSRLLCQAMKAQGITVYSVGFGLSNGSTAAQTLALCATDPSKNFNASDGEELRQAFRAIALELSKLYLSS